MGEQTNAALLGQMVLFVFLVGFIWIVFREVVKVALKVLIPAALLVGLAVWLGYLDETMVGNLLVTVGDGALAVVRPVADWVASAVSAG